MFIGGKNSYLKFMMNSIGIVFLTKSYTPFSSNSSKFCCKMSHTKCFEVNISSSGVPTYFKMWEVKQMLHSQNNIQHRTENLKTFKILLHNGLP